MNRCFRLAAVVFVAVAMLAPSQAANAVISGTAGQVTKIVPPASVLKSGGLASNTSTWAFDEQQGVTLASPLTADITQVGSYESNASRTVGTIPAGTTVDSHFFDSDR